MAVVVVAVSIIWMNINDKNIPQFKRFSVSYPFVFSKEINPANIITVGDQVICEHIFAFHARESLREGFSSVISNIIFDEEDNKITINPQFNLKSNLGLPYDINKICNSIKNALKGTSHIPIEKLITKIECLDTKINIYLTSIPVNIRYLFTLADLSLFFPDQLPITNPLKSETTGPYQIISYSEREIKLKPNPNYPTALKANEISEVTFKSYLSSETSKLVKQAKPDKDPLIYFYGHALVKSDLDVLKLKGYRIRQMPSEWLVYIGIQKHVPLEDREKFFLIADKWRSTLLEITPLGQAAFSLSPSDRAFGLTEQMYYQSLKKEKMLQKSDQSEYLSKKYTLGTLEEWSEIPLFQDALKLISSNFPNINIKKFSRGEIEKIWSAEVDFSLSPLGIAPSDPISGLSFLEEFRDLVSISDINFISSIKNPTEFNNALLEIEKKIVAQRRWLPIGHFPGVVAEAPNFHRDESISWSWGIQAWTYQISSK